ncbi:MAG: tetratricopeptide repeat protein [Akkermansiaceae bacterium]|nr:tetratricopeptide repeat protein [Akkermansiaceae bacterium]
METEKLRKPSARLVLPLLASAAALVLGACDKKPPEKSAAATTAKTAAEDKPILPPDDEVHSRYAGSETCKECHEALFKGWETSNHGLAERAYRADMDEKIFVPRRTHVEAGVTSETFLDADGVAKILTQGKDGKQHSYVVKRIIGNDPLRQFLVPAPGGRLQTCDISYDPHKDELFDVYGSEERLPGDWGHWTGQGMNWNAMCAACHNTRLRKNYDPATDSYHTAMAEPTVSCESCHGPMKDHVAWQRNPPAGYDPETNTPADPTATRFTRDQMLDTCAACHSRRSELSGDLVPGEPYHDHFSLVVTDETDIYHPDGQVRDENYVFAAFRSSRMHHAGIRCVDCHDPHTNKRLIPGNLLCMRCHGGGTEPPAPIIDPLAHSHHAEGSTGNDCTNCHMPQTTYMQRHPRRDHGFTSPDPLLTVKYGIPNACSRCHTDQSPEWALEHSEKWYGDKLKRPARERAMIVADARLGQPSARDRAIEWLKTEEIDTWRATMCHLLERWVYEPKVARALQDRFKDESPLVREAAVRSVIELCRNSESPMRKAVEPMLEDESRSVRIAAAWALCDTLDLKSRAGKELVHKLDLDSDQPTGRMQLSQFAFRRGDTPGAIRQIKKAIEWDPNSPPFHHDLAILLSTTGDIPGAIKSLQDAIKLAPQEAEFHYKLALAYNETGDLPKTIGELQTSLKLDPTRGRAWYNLGLAYNSTNQPEDAVKALVEAEKHEPSDPMIPYARATILARLQRTGEAIQATQKAISLRPDFPEAIQLLQMLSR